MTLGDSRTGKLAGNLAAFGRTLRRAGVQLDSARIGLSAQAALEVGLSNRHDLSAALEAVLVSREQDRMVFRELFEAFFRDPNMAHKLLSQMLPSAEGKAEPSKRRPRVREALSPPKIRGPQAKPSQHRAEQHSPLAGRVWSSWMHLRPCSRPLVARCRCCPQGRRLSPTAQDCSSSSSQG